MKQNKIIELQLTSVCHHHVGIYTPSPCADNSDNVAWSHHTVQLNRLDFADLPFWLGGMQRHTLILLSRQGTQAVVTCFRGAFLGLSGSGDMLDTMFLRRH